MRKIGIAVLAALCLAVIAAAAVRIVHRPPPFALPNTAQALPPPAKSTADPPSLPGVEVAELSPEAKAALAITKDDRILGKPDAPVTIIEYASLSCPHCADFEAHTLPKIKKDWIDTGKAKLILRDFPLDAPALAAAVLARCAPADRFYAFTQALFATQAQWVFAPDRNAALARIGKLGGMDGKEVDRCLADKALEKKVIQSRLTASKDLDVEATPTFFINGIKLGGEPRSLEEFEKLLQNAAAKAGKG